MSNHATLSGCQALVLLLVAVGLGCSSKPAATAETANADEGDTTDKADEAEAIDPSKLMSIPEVVFDPRDPPAGFTKCHRNHCHRVGGGVASYAQVMEEIGATKIIGVPKPKPMPSAPSDVAAAPADALKTKSGLAMKVLKPGTGKKPAADSSVVVHYTGWTTGGRGFDSSVARGKPATIPLGKLNIKGMAEALRMMSTGEERRLWLPEELAFEGKPGRPRGTLVFDVELLEIL